MNNKEIPILTIDGPSGSGKGTISRSVAGQLGWHLLDSGALYRLVAWSAHQTEVPRKWSPQLERVVLDLNVRFESDEQGDERILLDDQDVTFNIRTEDCGHMASEVAVIPEVRLALVQLQRNFQQPPGLVADGRDMGTVIFPEAKVKIFLTANPEERAQRRY
ncbi:MAG: (d)CMP kinase, partial [Pseudomonadota bacterium]